MIEASEFNFDSLYAAHRQARASHLSLCIATDGGWAAEARDAWLPNQLCRISGRHSREGLEALIRDHIVALNRDAAEWDAWLGC